MKYLQLVFVFFLHNSIVFSQNKDSVWTLNKCIEYAIRNNISIYKSKINKELNYKNLEQSKFNKIPIISANATQQLNSGRSIDPFSNQFVNQDIWSNNFNINGSLVVFNGFQNNNTIKYNNALYESSLYDIKNKEFEIKLKVLASYMEILLFAEQIKNLENQKIQTEFQIDKNKKLVQNGSTTEEVYLKFYAQKFTDEKNILSTQNQLEESKLKLCQLLNIAYNSNIILDTNVTNRDFQTHTIDNISLENLYSKHPSIVSMNLKLKSYSYLTESNKAGLYPKLTLSAGIYSLYSSQNKKPIAINPNANPLQYSFETLPFGEQLSTTLSKQIIALLNIPILNGRTARINVQKSILNNKTIQFDLELEKQRIEQEVFIAQNGLNLAIKKNESANEKAKAMKKTFIIIDKKYQNGLIDSYIFIEERNNMLNANKEAIHAKYDLTYKYLYLKYLTLDE